MGILDNLEAYLELDEDHSSLSSKVFEETVCKDCTDKVVD
jgi:hypothetical protein